MGGDLFFLLLKGILLLIVVALGVNSTPQFKYFQLKYFQFSSQNIFSSETLPLQPGEVGGVRCQSQNHTKSLLPIQDSLYLSPALPSSQTHVKICQWEHSLRNSTGTRLSVRKCVFFLERLAQGYCQTRLNTNQETNVRLWLNVADWTQQLISTASGKPTATTVKELKRKGHGGSLL